MKRKLLRCMSVVATMLLACSCMSELALEGVPQSRVDGEEVEVTFSVSAQSANAAMRADQGAGGPGQWQEYIGRGKEIDMLIYAVYEYDEDENTEDEDKYVLLPQYGQELVGFNDTPGAIGEVAKHKGQTIINVGDKFKNGESEEITLRLMRNKKYHIAFWAQNSTTTAFNTEDLKKVQVDYDNAKNNDELRDAFCKVETFSVSANSSTRKVILTRPFAQINVGATGETFTQSQIVLKGVSKSINVVEDKISEPETEEVTFSKNGFTDFGKGGEGGTLKVDLNNDGKVNGDTNDDEKEIPEVYTYLSMCYALVPAETISAGNVPNYASSVLSSVTISLSGVGDTTSKEIKLTNIPVHRNWRTNILWVTPEPDEKDVAITVNLSPDYDGEYNGKEGEENNWTFIPEK